MINSKVIRDNRRHITRADYNDIKPVLGSENVSFPKTGTVQSRALRELLPAGVMQTHREFDFLSHSYRLGACIDKLRDKGWTIVNHDETALTQDKIPRVAKFTRYELFAEFTQELAERVKAFCKAIDDFEAQAMDKGKVAPGDHRKATTYQKQHGHFTEKVTYVKDDLGVTHGN